MVLFGEIEQCVVEGNLPSKEWLPHQMNTYYAVQGLYQAFRGQYLDRQAAKRVKAELKRNYELTCEQYARFCCREIQYQYDIQMAGSLRAELVKSKDVQDALKTALRIISAMTGEEETERIVRGKYDIA
ncbi:MAG TPA: hypothetical protein DD414_08820 [Lachnospiraceae bacterium]|nr:hypothetical protein [Lachnospiraceae bacterium]